ncbi:SDR family oxidoreductase [Aestuariivita sp.]|jgi:3-oxoacyl-[acyl-carrier protein] reductase|uniref:SDR family NAD(P)-dependent oxidoreductase n=1 Tax=Aestuariivita sp. TaxID=1872407 RepID=UPI00216D473F|nr:SDR family oxidoreductase [Aestuariivita sp.]MCE8009108.1 SDR family oxidoreductase [Aestuariivita sp.]
MTSRTAIVTGGGGTLGLAIGAALIRDGWHVVLWDIDPHLHEAARTVGAAARVVDITEPAACAHGLIEDGPIGALIHCAGIGQIVPFDQLDRELWDRFMTVNLTAPVFLTQAALPSMLEGGAVIMVASVSGIRAGFGRVGYGTSKAAMIHLARQLAVELAPRGITCNAIAPGPVEGPLAAGSHPPEQVADYVATIPQGRYAQPQEIAETAAFLASPRASHITGQCLAVDGGYLAAGVGVTQARAYAQAPP